ncbi:MAG TPA: hypothetical protein VFR16_11125 [Agromyces mariniharenae]|nr:hypothetical protein [Agromyces mariniharenae]
MMRIGRLRRRTALPAVVLAAGLALGLSACAASSENTAAAMHASVVQISERAAAGDYAGALAELALLERDVATAAENGSIDAAREAEILTAMDVVRADLEAADVDTTPAPEPTTEPTDDNPDPDEDNPNKGPGNNSGNNGNNGNGNSGNDGGGDD